MVKILIIEDEEKKLNEIFGFIRDQGVQEREIFVARTLVEFSDKLNKDIDICVIDLRIPAYQGAKAEKNGIGVLQHLEASVNANVKLLAISAFSDEFEQIRSTFERQGCILADYYERDVWQNALKF